jgi:outer membrane lipoprotein-sorting protein
MKKLITLSIALLAFSFSNGQETKKIVKQVKKTASKLTIPAVPKTEGAGMVFVTETIDYGTIAHNADGNRKFEFTNNGNKPLIISNTQGSCGCTVPTTPKEPIAPGAKGSIGVHYATDRVGPFTKTVTVTSNAEGMPTKTLTIKGTVLADPTPAVTATPAAPATKS